MMGRKSSYKEEYANQALKLCLLGAIDKELAEFFGVSEQTLNKWKKDFPEFLESLKKGKISRMPMWLLSFIIVPLATTVRLLSSPHQKGRLLIPKNTSSTIRLIRQLQSFG